MSFNFQVPGNFDISQNANLYVMDISAASQRKYHWDIDCGDTLNGMFSNASYQQDATNANHFNVVLTLANAQVESWLTTTGLSNAIGGSATNGAGLEAGAQDFNLRLLEIAALEIFGHAKARAAIGNDSEFVGYETVVKDHMYNAFATNQSLQNDFFETYVLLDRAELNNNDVTVHQAFNLADSIMYVYGNIQGNVVDATPSTVGDLANSTHPATYAANMRIAFDGLAAE
jgi:hypothetical protein